MSARTESSTDTADGFSGIPLAALDFYEDLEDDNSRAFWLAHKSVYDTAVRRPIELLMVALAPEFGPAKIFRPYRDVRYAKDKTPYKTQQGAVIHPPDASALYLHVGAAGLYVGGGMYHLNSDQVQRLRRAVDDDVTGSGLVRIVTALQAAAFQVGGDELTRVPAGFAKDHPRADLLRRKSLTAGREFGAPDWLGTARALDEVAAAWRSLAGLNRWLGVHVGPSEQPRR